MNKSLKINDYIRNYWPLLVNYTKSNSKPISELKDDENIFLPYSYVVPGGIFDTMFYWDSFFTIVGVRHYPEFHYLLKGIVDNCLYMIDKYGRVLNSNKKKWASRSQLPFLTSMINIVFELFPDETWLKNAMFYAEKEYTDYWCRGKHMTESGLSRFYEDSGDNYMTRHTEVSWDMSPRYDDDDTTDLLPVDLNANLYVYEKHFQRYYSKTGHQSKAKEYSEKAMIRKKLISKYMWCEQDGLYYDFNQKTKKQKKIRSLAAYVPMWAGLSRKRDAQRLVWNLRLFEHDYGLATCDRDYGCKDRQWNYPYGWAPLHWMVFHGLKRYGYLKEAHRIAKKWIILNMMVFEKTFLMWEKYNVVDGNKADIYDRYQTQHGFGWTNGVFLDLAMELSETV
ncbi:hypothetical protein JW935_23015 [candidate division KSB1 bacterium]|nr:hypothetical protein [candidate division KSB1 bacterium]